MHRSALKTARTVYGAVSDRYAYRHGQVAVQIADLVSPLRYDIMVRADYFAFLRPRLDQYREDFPGYLAAAAATPYFLWFEKVALPRYRPDIAQSPARVRAAFRERVRRSTDLYLAFAARGFDDRHPISLRTAVPGALTSTGKHVERPFYAGDGCHRLALLLTAGYRELPASFYRVRRRRRTTIIDNTALLLRLLAVTPDQYYEFLSQGYAPGRSCPDADSLVAHVAATAPARLEELRQVLAIDASLVPLGGSAQ